MDAFTDLLEGPGGFGLGRLLGRLPRVAVALAGRADADLLLVGTVAAVAAVTAGAHVVDRLRGGGKKEQTINTQTVLGFTPFFLPHSSVCPYLKQQPVNLLADFLYVRVHDLPAVVRWRGKDIFVHGTPETTGRRVTEPARHPDICLQN